MAAILAVFDSFARPALLVFDPLRPPTIIALSSRDYTIGLQIAPSQAHARRRYWAGKGDPSIGRRVEPGSSWAATLFSRLTDEMGSSKSAV
jgi:hypothetical protein